MSRTARLVLILLTMICMVVLAGCPKEVETTEPGPGGLPRGMVSDDNAAQATDDGWPVYEGAQMRARGVYETPDRIQKVRDYYVDLLETQAVTLDPAGETFTFETDEFTLVLLPLADSGGTEIRFTSKETEQE